MNAIKDALNIKSNIKIGSGLIRSFTHSRVKIGILILSNSDGKGSLEDLILSTCEENLKEVIENFLKQLKSIGLKIEKENKFKVHCFFGAKCSKKLYLKLSNAIQNCDFINLNERLLTLQEEIVRFFTTP